MLFGTCSFIIKLKTADSIFRGVDSQVIILAEFRDTAPLKRWPLAAFKYQLLNIRAVLKCSLELVHY